MKLGERLRLRLRSLDLDLDLSGRVFCFDSLLDLGGETFVSELIVSDLFAVAELLSLTQSSVLLAVFPLNIVTLR